MVTMSQVLLIRVWYCGRFQKGESAPLSMVEPQAPRLVTLYSPHPYSLSSAIWSWNGYVWLPPVECTPAVICRAPRM